MLTNADWVNRLPAYEVHYMPAGVYDHSHAIIKWDRTGTPKMRISDTTTYGVWINHTWHEWRAAGENQ